MANKIQVKRGLDVNLPILDEGEPAFTTDTKRPFIGSKDGNVELATKEQINDLDDEVVVIKQQLEDGTAGIDDSIVSENKVWSSSKTQNEIGNFINLPSTVYIGEESNPPTDPNIKLWFKIIKPQLVMPVTDTFFHFDANSLSALEDNTKISLWEDLSGNGNDLTVEADSRRPKFLSAGLNEKPAVWFDLTESYQYLRKIPFTLDRTNGATLFMVYSLDGTASVQPLSIGVETDATPKFGIYTSGSKVNRPCINKVEQGEISTVATGTPLLFSFAWSLTETKLYKNGVLAKVQSYSGAEIGTHDRLIVGAAATGGGIIDGKISEIIYFSRTLTTQETELMNAYLLEKWGFA